MCLNCGCGELDERHGNEANIVADDVRRAATANGQDAETTVRNMEDSLRGLRGAALAGSGAGGRSATGSSDTGRDHPGA